MSFFEKLRTRLRSNPMWSLAVGIIIVVLFVAVGAYFAGDFWSEGKTQKPGEKTAQKPAGPPGTVKIDPATVQNIGVKTLVVKPKTLTRNIRTVGRVSYDERKLRWIAPKISGWIERQYVDFPGQVVRKGQRLLNIYSPDLVATQEEYLVALRYRDRMRKSPFPQVAEGGESLLRAARKKLDYWDITEKQIQALKKRGEVSRTMALYAPFKGIVVEENIPEGGHVSPGQKLYGIADISTVWVYADIYEYEAPWLRLGQEAQMTLAYRPGQSYQGQVVYIYPYLKNETRTIQVRMEFTNSDDFQFKPDMWANVTLYSPISRDGLAVPVQAVFRTGTKDIVLVALGEGRFAPREVRLGAQAGEEFEVLEGLEEGDRIVTSAHFLINSESSLQSAVSKMTGGKSGSDVGEGKTERSAPPRKE
jgi:RND family efflux transporter MFP subunit